MFRATATELKSPQGPVPRPTSETKDKEKSSLVSSVPIVLPGETLPEFVPDVHALMATPLSMGGTAMSALRTSMRKETKVIFGASYQVSSGSTGVTNQVVSNVLLGALTEFKAVAPIWQEFFVSKFAVLYEPASRYSKRTGSAGAADANDVPLIIVSLQHNSPPFATHTDAASCADFIVATTCDNWSFTWKNNEKKSQGVLPTSGTTSAQPTQSWCQTDVTSAGLYAGEVQLLSPAAMVNPVLNLLYGTVVVRWEVYFRSRS